MRQPARPAAAGCAVHKNFALVKMQNTARKKYPSAIACFCMAVGSSFIRLNSLARQRWERVAEVYVFEWKNSNGFGDSAGSFRNRKCDVQRILPRRMVEQTSAHEQQPVMLRAEHICNVTRDEISVLESCRFVKCP